MRLLGVAALLLILGVVASRHTGKRKRYITDVADINRIRILPGTNEVFVMMNYGEWAPLCQEHWGREEAEVACRQLGKVYHDMMFNYNWSKYRRIAPGFRCYGDEENFSQCEPFPEGVGCVGQKFIVTCKDAEPEESQERPETDESYNNRGANSRK